MAAPSQNKYYNHPDLAKIKDQLADIMGIGSGSASADRNYLTDLRGVSKLEGNMMDNRKKEGIWNALQLAVQGKNPDEALARHSGISASDLQKLYKGEKLLPGEYEQQQQKTAHGTKMAGLFDQMMGIELPPQRKEDQYGLSGREGQRGAEVARGDALTKQNFADAARKWMLANKIQIGPDFDPSNIKGLSKEDRLEKLNVSKINYEVTKKNVAQRVGGKKVEKYDEEIKEIGDRILLKRGLNAAQIMEIKNRALNDIAELDQKILTETGKRLTEEKRRGLIAKKMETEVEKLLGEKSATSKKISEATIARKKLWATSGDLYRKQRKQEVELDKLKAQLAKATDEAKGAKIKARIVEKTEKLEMAAAKAKSEKAVTDAAFATEKLNNLKASHKEKLATLKKQLAKATGDAEITEIKKLIAEATKQFKIDKAELDLANAKLTGRKISGEIMKNLIGTLSPADIDRKRRFKEGQIAAQGDGAGDGTIDAPPDGTIPTPQFDAGGKLIVDKTLQRGPKSKGFGGGITPDKTFKSIFKGLKASPDLKNWGPEEVEAVVQKMMEKYPSLFHPDKGGPARIMDLINKAKAQQ